jgi:hypothetical protein
LVVVVLNFTVHVADELLASAVGAQESEVICPGTIALALMMKVWDPPFKVAVSNAD